MQNKVLKYINELARLVVRPASILALIYALLAFGASTSIDYVKDSRKERTARIGAIAQEFNDTSKEFDALVAATANGIMDLGRAEAADKSKLMINLNRQYSEIDEIAPIVKSNAAIEKYKKSLSDLNAVLPDVNNTQSMRTYWSRVSDVLAARRDLRSQLNKRAGLEID